MSRTTGVFKRGKVYWIRYSVAGQQFRESARTTRKAEAEALLYKRQSEIFEGSFFPDRKRNDLTVDGLKDMWLDAAADKKTIQHDRQRFERIVEHFGPRTLIVSITSEDIDEFKRSLRRTKTRLGGEHGPGDGQPLPRPHSQLLPPGGAPRLSPPRTDVGGEVQSREQPT